MDDPTWNVTAAEMYPAIMESLVALHDRVERLSRDLASMHKTIDKLPVRIGALEAFRFVAIVATVTAVVGLAVTAVLKI